MKKLIIGALSLGLAFAANSADALRCGVSLVKVGDLITDIQEICPGQSIRAGGIDSDIVIHVYKANGMTYKMIFIDQHLKSIQESRL